MSLGLRLFQNEGYLFVVPKFLETAKLRAYNSSYMVVLVSQILLLSRAYTFLATHAVERGTVTGLHTFQGLGLGSTGLSCPIVPLFSED